MNYMKALFLLRGKLFVSTAIILFMTLVQLELFAANYYVSTTGNNGAATSWATAKTSIQGAINVASSGDVIIVKYGSYTISTQITVGSKNLKITSDVGTATSWETATPDSSQCILTGNGSSRIFLFDNSSITTFTIIRGFKITAGNSTTYATNGLSGGGILIKAGADPTIENCWITGNYACKALNGVQAASGGGIFIQDSSPIIQYNLISGNIATNKENEGYGGGISVYKATTSAAPIIRYNTITGNYATTYAKSTSDISFANLGGGIYVWRTTGEITGNVFKDNICAYRETYSSTTYTSLGLGGAIAIDDATTTISNNIFVGNQALSDPNKYGIGGNPAGGAIYIALTDNYSGTLTIVNNTFYNNKLRNSGYYNYGTQQGQAIYLGESSGILAVIENNIFSSHSSSYGDGVAIYSSTSKTVNYNNFYTNTNPNVNVTSNNQVTSDPLFVNAASDDFNLQSTSPCINTGDPTTTVTSGGEPIIDIGAKECINNSSSTNNSVDNSFTGNFINGKAFAVEAESGTVNCTSQLYLSSPPNNSNNKRNIGRYWDISATGNSKIRLYYPSSSKTGFTGSPTIYHYNGSSWEAIPTNAEQTEGTSLYVESTNPVTSWSNFTVGDSNDPLPAELTSFSAQVLENTIILHWQTSTEVNNFGFEIERSSANASWSKLGFVNGSGNSNSSKEYTFSDQPIKEGHYFYRLKQIDNDGKFEYSKVVEVNYKLPTQFSLEQNYPNPFNPSTIIKYSVPYRSNVSLKIFDLLGKQVAEVVNEEQAEGNYEIKFDASGLSSGLYFYRLTSGLIISTRKMILTK